MKTRFIIICLFGILVILSSCETDPLEAGGKELADIDLTMEKSWGTPETDDFAGSVIDNSGNMYMLSSSSGLSYIQKVYLTKINLDNNTLVWSKTISSTYSNYFPSPSENGSASGGGGSRCIAIDGSDNIYIAGTCTQGYNQVFVMKLNTYGDVLWQRNWEADDSGMAKGSAKAFAIDVNNNRVYVTGATGAGTSSEEAMIFLLMLDTFTGDVLDNTTLGIDPSPTYNDRGYTVKAADNGYVYIGGWEGESNSGLLLRFSSSGDVFDWAKRINMGQAQRITDLDIDESGYVYLACDFRGTSTYMGILKLSSDGDFIWGKKYQGRNNDINNISCLRIINSMLYVGGRGSFEKYDLSQFGDGCLIKMDLSGYIIGQINYFTGEEIGNNCGERIESINYYNGEIVLAGESWPEYNHIAGHWYIPEGNISDFVPQISNISQFTRTSGFGYYNQDIYSISGNDNLLLDLSEGNRGSSDIVLFSFPESDF
jgi:hypothetical protein